MPRMHVPAAAEQQAAEQTADDNSRARATAPWTVGTSCSNRMYRWPFGTMLTVVMLLALAALTACASSGRPSASASSGPTLITSCPPAASSAAKDRLSHVACLAVVKLAGNVTTTYDAQHQTVQVEVTFIGTRVPRSDQQIGATQEAVKTICFRTQRALWTSGIALTQVTVMVQGPILGDFFDVQTDWYGGSRVTSQTAAALDWQSLGDDGAWARYDQVWLRTAFAPNQYYSSTPRATP